MSNYIHTVENSIIAYSESNVHDVSKKNINGIAFKVKGTGTCYVKGMPLTEADGIVAFNNTMLTRDASRYELTIPSGTVVYVIETLIIKTEEFKITTNKC